MKTLHLLLALALVAGAGTVYAGPIGHTYKLFQFGSNQTLNGSIKITGDKEMDPFTTYQYAKGDITGWEFTGTGPGTTFHINGASASAYQAPFEARWDYIYERGGYGWYLYFDFGSSDGPIGDGKHTTFGIGVPTGGVGGDDFASVLFRKGGGVCPLSVCTAGGGLTWGASMISDAGGNIQIAGSAPVAKLIPIPSTVFLLGLGLAALEYHRRARKTQG